MAERPTIPKRTRIFVGAEGESERSFAKWIGSLCEEAGFHAHLDVRVCGGGDSFSVVEYSVEQLRLRRTNGAYSAGFILMDEDRVEEDRMRGRDPSMALDGENLRLVYLKPNIEGLLWRLHPGRESKSATAPDAKKQLRKLWPEYVKPVSAETLERRFSKTHLQRVAVYDADIRWILKLLGLW